MRTRPGRHGLHLAIVLAFATAAAAGQLMAQSRPSERRGPPTPGDARMVTRGVARTATANLFSCASQVRSYRASAVGRIVADDGTALTVPADTAYETGPKLFDLFNECSGTMQTRWQDVKADDVPVVEIDADGEVITGAIIADNYVELYVNGRLVGVDPVPYTPFNSVLVRFKARRPYTYALKLVDWEERLGLGMETNRGHDWYAGDGGAIARFSDGTVTDASWKAQAFYIAPLARPDDVIEHGAVHDTGRLGRAYPQAKVPDCRDRCFAVHYPVPRDWAAPGFDDSGWPQAFEFTKEEVGVDHLPAYTRNPEAFVGARWIWSCNLVLDNLVLARKTVR